MEPDRTDTDRPADDPATPPAPDRDDEVTSREAYEREMAEQGRSDEAARHGDHIE